MSGLTGFVKRVAKVTGFEIRRLPPSGTYNRSSLAGSLRTAANVGFQPSSILDIGAARGEWSLDAARVWPDATYLLVDPLDENRPALTTAVARLGSAAFVTAAVAREEGAITLNVHPDLDGSSLFEEREATVNGAPRSVRSTTVDALVAERGLKGPFLLKADVQGAELAVVGGAAATLEATELVVLEVLLFDFFQGAAPQLEEVVATLGRAGFVAWDVFGMAYRPIDGALSQVDMAFVRRDGNFRRTHSYATDEQRRMLSRQTMGTGRRR